MPTTAAISAIASFIVEDYKPTLGKRLRSMSDEEVGMSIAEAVSMEFPGFTPDDLLQVPLLAQGIV